ncbi:MAG: RluA family pseudouridine synthase [Cyanobacteria bacterium RUI128]|nr:RluA family pseudouridine synthase [Cyanobacteria bacterium RUI128]
MTNYLFKIDETDSDMRLDAYLSGVFDDMSRTRLQSFIKNQAVTVNGKTVKPSYVTRTDDEIECDFDSAEDIVIQPENIDIQVVYDDENIAIVNKPSGMLTHPTSAEKNGTLVNALLYKYGSLSDINGVYRPGILHRLDRNTSGLLIIAKHNTAHEKYAQMIKDREIEKHYRAVVKGRIDGNLVINEPIGRSKSQPNKMCVTPDGKPSLTEVAVIEQFENATYIDVNLKTGRTHQIRVHLSHAGHPVFNDTLYGFGKMKIKTEEQVLQSYKLKFINPFNGNMIDLQIDEDDKIKRVLKYLRNL